MTPWHLLVEQDAGPAGLTILATVLTVALAVGAIVGGAIKWVIVPNLRQMVEQIAETHKQVTENHHSNQPPTILDRFDDVESKLDRLDEKVDAHLISAAAIDATTAARVKAIERRLDM